MSTDSTWQVGTKCVVYSRKANKWYDDGIVSIIEKKYMTVWFAKNTKYKKFAFTSKNVIPIKEENLHLKINSLCEIFSIDKWCQGMVMDIYDDSELPAGTGEWLKIDYHDENNDLKQCDLRRHSVFLRPSQFHDSIEIPSSALTQSHIHHLTKSSAIISNYQYLTSAATGYTSSPNRRQRRGKISADWQELNSLWIKLSDFPKYITEGQMIAINDIEFISAESDGIYKYNIYDLEWEFYIEYPMEISTYWVMERKAYFDEANNELYVYQPSNPYLRIAMV